MKNKFITVFFVLIFSLHFSKFSTAEEFNFDTTELQVTENGNLIKGIDGGIITTKNNEIVITADTFIYNKLTTLLEAEGNVKLFDKIENIIIGSDKIFYLKNKEEIYTIGKSKAINGVNFEIDANEYFRYNKLTSLLEAKGDVVLNDRIKDITIYTDEIFYLKNEEKISTLGKTFIDVENQYKIKGHDLTLLRNEMILSSNKKAIIKDDKSTVYELNEFVYSINKEILKGKDMKVTTNFNKDKSDEFFFETGFFNLKENKFLTRDVLTKLHKNLFGNDENDPRFNSVFAKGDEFNTYYEKAVFTSCKKTDKCPPWKMSAPKIHHDKVKKQIIYRNAWLEIYDFPVAYFPKFFHPDPTVKRQSGILMPEIGDHDTLGESIYLPYFLVISDDKDVTIKPRLFNNAGEARKFVLQTEYRQETKNSLTIIDSSITTGHYSDKADKPDKDTRSHFFTNTKIKLDLDSFILSDLEINYEKASNDTYLKLFKFIKSPLLIGWSGSLKTEVKLDLEHEGYDFTTSLAMYETLSGLNSDRYQYVLPSYDFSKSFFLGDLDGSFNFNSFGNNTLSETNITTSTLFNNLNYNSYNSFLDNGIKTNFQVLLKNVNSVGKKNINYKNSPQSELMSSYSYNVSMPLEKENENNTNTLIPKLSFKFSPHDMKNYANTSRRINAANVFSNNRLTFGDSFESGESITLGVDFTKLKKTEENEITEIEEDEIAEIAEYFDFKLATVFRIAEEKNIPINSTLNKKTSNIFGRINFNPNKIISMGYDFSISNDVSTFEYNALNTKFTYNDFSTKFIYQEERGVIGQKNTIENTTKYNFNEFNSLLFATRRNRHLNLTEYYDAIYEYKNDCLIASIKYNKTYYSSGDIVPMEELFFSITIVPLTTFSPDKMILNKDRID